MSYFRDNRLLQKGFASLPNIGNVLGFIQTRGSFDPPSTSGHLSSMAAIAHGVLLQEGDLITGTIDVAHEQAHMVPPIQNPKHEEEESKIVCPPILLLTT